MTIEIPEAKHFFYVPENLGECDGKQYLDICKLLYWLNFGFISEDDFKSMAVYTLLGLPYKLEKSKCQGFTLAKGIESLATLLLICTF